MVTTDAEDSLHRIKKVKIKGLTREMKVRDFSGRGKVDLT